MFVTSTHGRINLRFLTLLSWVCVLFLTGLLRLILLTVPRRYFFCGSFIFLFCLVFAMFCARLFICALWSPAGKGLTSWLSFVVSSVSLSLSHWYPGSGVVLDCIDSWSLQPYYFTFIKSWHWILESHIKWARTTTYNFIFVHFSHCDLSELLTRYKYMYYLYIQYTQYTNNP